MKNLKIPFFLLIAAVAAGCEKKVDTSKWPPIPEKPPISQISDNYQMGDGKISEESLKNYLMRAITQTEFLSSPGLNTDGIYGTADDERMLLNIGAKFIGRSLYSWGKENLFEDAEWLPNAKAKIDRMHSKDPDMMFQAALFEVVTPKVNNIPVPAWVFTAFGKTPETRNFSYDAIKGTSGMYINQWGADTCVPDMSQEETRMFFYYMAVKYMEIGIEAFHCGQVELMANMGDKAANFAGWRDLLAKIREAAATKARRKTVIMDAHMSNGGIKVGDDFMFDFTSFPLRLKEVTGTYDDEGVEKMAAELKKGYSDAIIGFTPGGRTPSGWTTNRMPYILEFDNFGISSHPGVAANDHFVWGYDEITWMYLQSTEDASAFLYYLVDYMRNTDPAGYIQMPGCRVVRLDPVTTFYRCNNNSEATPTGNSTESTIKTIWETY